MAGAVDEEAFALAYAGPAVRKLARELGVDLGKVKGSGNHGRILREDVEAFGKGGAAPAKPQAAAASGGGVGGIDLLPWPKVDFAKYGPVERKELGRIKKISAANLHRNWVVIPHVTTHDEADITDLEQFRVKMNKELEKSGVKLSLLPFMVKAAVATLQKFPEFNASLDGDTLVYKNYWHIGFAADTPNGLMVPVIRDADKKSVPEIAKEMNALAKLAREGKIKPDQMQGGTFSISSLGGIGGIYFTPIINAPEVAIMGVCKGYWKQHSLRRQDVELAADAAAVAVLGSPRHRRRGGRALQRLLRQCARRFAARAVLRSGGSSMAQQIEVKVPDIGDFKDVAVIEVMVKPGETVAVDTSLIMVESDKASMEIPSSHAGVVKEVKVKVDDKVSEGSTILVLEAAGAAAAPTPAPASQPAAAAARRRLRLPPHPIPARRISNATCWCWAPVPAATRPPSAPPISA